MENLGSQVEKNGTPQKLVGAFLNALENAAQYARLHSFESQDSAIEPSYQDALNTLEQALEKCESFELVVNATDISLARHIVYSNQEKKTSLNQSWYQDGIRMIIFKRGIARKEVLEFIEVLASDFSKPEVMDQDLYCLLQERSLPHIEIWGRDLLAELTEENPSLSEEVFNFIKEVKRKNSELNSFAARRMRADDLKVLEEFRLSPLQFAQSDEEVSKVLRSIAGSRGGQLKEVETLERFLGMGLHYLLAESDLEQKQIGRDLVSKVALMILKAGAFELFEALLHKIYQLQKDKYDQSGQYQKILDFLFHTDQLELYNSLFKNEEYRAPLGRILLQAPPAGIRLVILLLGRHPWLTLASAEYISRHLSQQMNWLLEEVERKPNAECWEHLTGILTQKFTHCFPKFIEALLKYASQVTKQKVLSQLAKIGNFEILELFEELTQSSELKQRLEAYELLGTAKNRAALDLLKARWDMLCSRSPSGLEQEKQVLLTSIIQIEGEAAYPWFESIWFQPAKGFFKRRIENERRRLLLAVMADARAEWLRPLMEKSPLQSWHHELRKTVEQNIVLRKWIEPQGELPE